jgi:hypothetical protein
MKLRQGFVSNSSSSSFIIGHNDIGMIATSMLNVIIQDWADGKGPSKMHKEWQNNLKIALKRQDVLEGKIGITMPSCNYETYIFVYNNKVYISTSHNHEWKLDYRENGHGSDDGDDDIVHGKVKDRQYFNVKNRLIHSKAEYIDWSGKVNRACPNCKIDYAQYVVYMGKNLCSECYKGIIGTNETIEPVAEKYVDVEKEYQEAKAQMLKNMSSIKFLDL